MQRSSEDRAYNAQGTVIEWEGTWDEKKTVLNWKASLQGGYAGDMRWEFPSDDRFEFNLLVKSGSATVLTMSGTMNRAK